MSTRARVGLAGLAAVSLAALAALVVRTSSTSDAPGSAAPFRLAAERPAVAPFVGLTETRVSLGGRCLRVAVGDTRRERAAGLRARRGLGPYDGMLFVFPADTNAAFTMAQTPLPLDIVWFTAAGSPVDRARLTPCPHGTDATCPAYRSRRRYRYALETPGGPPGGGALGGCG